MPALSVSGGSIVNITSLAGVHPTGSGSSIAYGVAKAAVNHLTVLMANALGHDGIRVNANADQIREPLRGRTLLGRPGTSSELAHYALMLAAPGYATAQVMLVDGGMRFRVPRLLLRKVAVLHLVVLRSRHCGAAFSVRSLPLCSHRRHIGSCLASRARAVAVIIRGEGMFPGGSG